MVHANSRVVRVGIYENEPKIFSDANGQPSGILGELLMEIAQREQWVLMPIYCDWQVCLESLKNGDLDLMPDVAFNDQRAAIFDFHKIPALLSWSQIYKHSGVTINTALDLQGKRIALLDGSVQQTYVQDLLKGFAIRADIVPVKSFKQGFELVQSGGAEAVAANNFFGDLQAQRFQLDSTPILFQPAKLFYATAKGSNADLLAAIDIHLEQWGNQANSPYQKILGRWMKGEQRFTIPGYVWWALAALAALLGVAVGISLLLRWEVSRKTHSLQASEDKLAAILNGVDAYIYIKDTELRYQYVNRKVADLFNLPVEAIVGKTDAEFFDADTVARLRANDLRVIEAGERVDEEEQNRSADGDSARVYHSIKLPLRKGDGSIYALCGISTDITRHKEAEQAIHQLAFFDPLTKLPNRRLLLRNMQLALRSADRHQEYGALLFVDVDNFKDLNDTMGHPMGDQLLQHMAQRLSQCTRTQDSLARLGGDEFVLMLQGLGSQMDAAVQQARLVAQKVSYKLSEPYLLDGGQFTSSVSVGVAMFTGQELNQDELLKQADLAMYRAKAEGRNRICFFDPQMQAQVNERTALEAAMREGITNGQFVLHYQPQIRADGEQVGMEALVRWQHPTRGLVTPSVFIPVAESSGLILPLGQWILETACRQAVVWSQQPDKAHWVLSINVSARQFRQADFVEQVRSALRVTGAQPHHIELELTESQLVDDVEGVVLRMEALKALGVRLSLDDFGTGYSSLSMIKRLPLDQLKIDQSFVRDLGDGAHDSSIVRAIVNMGESLGLRVIAEGVETEAQREVLLGVGCQYFQGYLLGRPAPAE
ncbi:EAL domain-containing protein [Rhodoferax sp. GW822-FHT02A01]|uniref:EAL domain-containing protein n=1 Tax=Rhodoferax sp. GW822-FHT02A01 TaxID=3141537 RepID=UPI00315DC42B